MPNPTHRVLSTLRARNVSALLMGGQACIVYGAAEFSRDTDLAILADDDNLNRLRTALADLDASTVAVPPFERAYLERGHAVHFRCAAPGVEVMALTDLVVAKKTRRDKDWPMIRRLLEADYWNSDGAGAEAQVEFWLRELRTPELLIDCARAYPAAAARVATTRGPVTAAQRGDLAEVEALLDREMYEERAADRDYWAPLLAELEQLRRDARRD